MENISRAGDAKTAASLSTITISNFHLVTHNINLHRSIYHRHRHHHHHRRLTFSLSYNPHHFQNPRFSASEDLLVLLEEVAEYPATLLLLSSLNSKSQ